MRQRIILVALAVCIIVFGLCVYSHGPFTFGSDGEWSEERTTSDIIFLSYILLHTTLIATLLSTPSKKRAVAEFTLFKSPEILAFIGIVLFLFTYIYALSANMDYVQRFAMDSENLRIAPESKIERLNVGIRYAPFLALDLGWWGFVRLNKKHRISHWFPADPIVRWGFLIALLSAVLYALSFPSFARLGGIGALGFICMIPLFVLLYRGSYGNAVLYGLLFGTVQMMLINYWLGTYSLISLQFLTATAIVLFTLFMVPGMWLFKRTEQWGFLVLPALWTFFDFARSLGFIGYPWGMIGVSQYQFTSFIQIAAIGGVWLVTFMVVAVNAAIAHGIVRTIDVHRPGMCSTADARKAWYPAAVCVLVVGLSAVGGGISNSIARNRMPERTARVTLIQQNTDPRKHEYRKTLSILKGLTNAELEHDPDIVIWSETAFVPNLRRWSKPEYENHAYGKLVREFAAYQTGIGTWLLTGNDDYEILELEDGTEGRYEYNASVLFTDKGARAQTYRKINLVPFTESFPYKDSLPRMYELLMDFDVFLWEPGTERIVFSHPLFTFSTPICFEDNFPQDIRAFVRAGAEVIVTLANDYWSLDEVEGMQHFANGVFRSVENRRPTVRATASGLTGYIDRTGKLISALPFYQPGSLTVDLQLHESRTTIYTRFGDWVPYVSAAILLLFFIGSCLLRRRTHSPLSDGSGQTKPSSSSFKQRW